MLPDISRISRFRRRSRSLPYRKTGIENDTKERRRVESEKADVALRDSESLLNSVRSMLK